MPAEMELDEMLEDIKNKTHDMVEMMLKNSRERESMLQTEALLLSALVNDIQKEMQRLRDAGQNALFRFQAMAEEPFVEGVVLFSEHRLGGRRYNRIILLQDGLYLETVEGDEDEGEECRLVDRKKITPIEVVKAHPLAEIIKYLSKTLRREISILKQEAEYLSDRRRRVAEMLSKEEEL